MPKGTHSFDQLDNLVEAIFLLDMILNFFQSFKNPTTFENVMDLKLIAKNYVFKGWFIIDFITVFPLCWFVSANNPLTKILKLFRLPRLAKLLDIERFNKIVKSLLASMPREDKISAMTWILYVYKIFRLVLIAIVIGVACMSVVY